MNFYQIKLKLMKWFNKFKMFRKHETYANGDHDVTITTAYISLNDFALKQLQSKVGERVTIAIIEESDHEKILIASSHDDQGFEVVQKDNVKKNHALIFISLGRKKPESKGNYFLKRYASHENHEWWEIVKEKPKKIRLFR